MSLSKTTIIELLMKQSEDLDNFISEMGEAYLGKDLREINSPVKLLIAWLSEEV